MSNPQFSVLGNFPRGRVFIVSAPAGTGKTTLVQMLVKEFSCVVSGISYTTRPMRAEEVSGIDYHFISQTEFEQKKATGDFLEYAEVFGHYYGTSKSAVEEKLCEGKHVILVIDTQGALQIRTKIPCTLIFLLPPSLEILQSRLKQRNSETPESLKTRLDWAEREMAIGKSEYDYWIVNDSLDIAYQVLKSIVIAEEHRVYSGRSREREDLWNQKNI